MKNTKIEVGSKVSFLARGGRLKGVVTKILYKRPGARLARRFGIVPRTVETAEVALDNCTDKYYTVPFYLLRVEGKVKSKNAKIKAWRVVGEIKDKRRSNNFERSHANYKVADEKGLFKLKRGDKIQVEYKGGYYLERTFVKLVRPSFNVGFQNPYNPNRTHFVNPKFVKVK